MNGKGSKRRPRRVSEKEFEENWERVFGKSSPKLSGKPIIVEVDNGIVKFKRFFKHGK